MSTRRRARTTSLVATGLPDACLSQQRDACSAIWRPGTIPEWISKTSAPATPVFLRHEFRRSTSAFDAETAHAGYLILHLRNYAAWKVESMARRLRTAYLPRQMA